MLRSCADDYGQYNAALRRAGASLRKMQVAEEDRVKEPATRRKRIEKRGTQTRGLSGKQPGAMAAPGTQDQSLRAVTSSR
jgi:hypothetical protein